MSVKPTGFIKANRPFVWDYAPTNLAPMFRRKFTVGRFARAEIAVCALGMGVFYLNGHRITQDLHISPTSDYEKTLWYNCYDVTPLLREGENTLACILGNGWYNESLKTCWEYREAVWRDNPKFALALNVDGEVLVEADENWRCKPESWVTFNQLRSGEHVDFRLYEPDWNLAEYDDSEWETAVADDQPPRGVLRKSVSPGVRECALYPAISVRKTGEKRYLFDVGQNISGYIRLHVRQKTGDVLTIRYAEQVEESGELRRNGMPEFYPMSPFQTDMVTLGHEAVTYSPMFTYHGFQFVEITGLDNADAAMVEGVFVHLDVQRLTEFECSNQDLNDLFRIGVMACCSNMHYLLTDCPTREKYGWLNDARASAEHLLMDFDIAPFFHKWFRDITDSVRYDGAVPGIAPTSGCEFDSFTGPICSCVIHEIAYKVYLYTGDDSLLIRGLPVMLKHLEYLRSMEDEDGLIACGLFDWAGPFGEDYNSGAPTPLKFTDSALYIEFMQRTILAAQYAKDEAAEQAVRKELARVTAAFKKAFLRPDGRCTVHEQTACAMLIGIGLYDNFEAVRSQLMECVEEHDFHMHTGMLGVRFLYDALNDCGLAEYACRIIAAEGFPSFTQWLREGANTLWETFYPGASKNHHMYSCFMLFLMDTLVGIRPDPEMPGMRHIQLNPSFVSQLSWCRGLRHMPYGDLKVEWRREEGGVRLSVDVPEGVVVRYADRTLRFGSYSMLVTE